MGLPEIVAMPPRMEVPLGFAYSEAFPCFGVSADKWWHVYYLLSVRRRSF